MNVALQDYLLDRMIIDEKTGCWNWIKSCSGKIEHPYGAAWFEGNRMGAHRASYYAFIGEIEIGLCVCHKCDNTRCINPKHLFLGTQKDNIDDCRKKGRFSLDLYYKNRDRLGRTSGAWLKGEDHGQSKLTNDQVSDILILLSNKVKQSAIAKEFGIDQSTVSNIKTQKRWKHLGGQIELQMQKEKV